MSFKIINRSLLFKKYSESIVKNFLFRRTILSSAYPCTEEWNKRLQEPLIKDIELDIFFYQLNEKLSKKTSIGPTDVDLFLNKAEPKNLNEAINVVQRFRKNWRSYAMLESSQHAFIRIMLDSGDMDKLVEMLSKRIEYGIFPDKFCYNLILDRLIDACQFENAAKVAVLRMIQEDFDSMIGNYLSLKAIHQYMLKSEIIKEELFHVDEEENESVEKDADDEDEDEVEYIRVPYLRNPFFDDHFDLKETHSLIGKTFYLVGNAIKNENSELSDNCILYGLILYKKWDQAKEFLDSKKSEIKLCKDLIQLVERFVGSNENAPMMLEQLKKINNTSTKTLEELIENSVSTIGKLEADEIRELKDAFQRFKECREEKIKLDLDNLLKLEIIEQIKEKKKEFKDRESKLYFFENFERLQLLEHKAQIKIKEAEESMNIEEEYIPPSVRKFRNEKQ